MSHADKRPPVVEKVEPKAPATEPSEAGKPELRRLVEALEGMRLCDGVHPFKKGCKDCARRLKRTSALLLLAVLPAPSSVEDVVESATRFRRAQPMAWPAIEMVNANGLVRALRMSQVPHDEASVYIGRADTFSAALK